MPTTTQTDRPLILDTPLGPDKLLLAGVQGEEGLSQLFRFSLDALAEHETDVAFDKLLGQPLTVHLILPDGAYRFFNGICSRVSQGESDPTFTAYRLEMVPRFWLWTQRAQSRIFQHLNVPDILKAVLAGLDVDFQLKGTFEPRDYCVQYRETDFNFASRLMEEEGIYYYFKHSQGSHKLVVANTPEGHAPLPTAPRITFTSLDHATAVSEDIIYDWSKTQELTSGKYLLWDHNFELPHKHFEADKPIQPTVPVGQVTHKLNVANNDKLEVYDYPGHFAERFDGIDKGGGEKPADLQKIFHDNARTVEIRMQQEALATLIIQGASNCRQMVSGHKFTLATLSADQTTKLARADGDYVLRRVTHSATRGNAYRSGDAGAFEYTNHFQAIPVGLPFRPPRVTPKPVVAGSQTAVVVGPAGEEIFTDKYSRVKVQFHWDRQGKNDADSSCWVRVASQWAGKSWGMISIPRIGQEVVVGFLEGDPDLPIIVGSVYNAEQMPPYALPGNKTQSGIKSRSTLGGNPETNNEICFEDKKGSELLYIRAEKDQTIGVENDEAHWVGHDRDKTVDNDERVLIHHDRTKTVDNNETNTIGVNRKEKVGSNETIDIGANRTETVGKNESITVALTRTRMVGVAETVTVGAAQAITVGAARTVTVGAMQAITVGASQTISVGGSQTISVAGGETESYGKDHKQTVGGGQTVTVAKDGSYSITGGRSTSVGKDDGLKVAKNLMIDAGEQIVIKTGDASITMKKDGSIHIKGKNILIEGSGKITSKADGDHVIKGSKVGIN